MRFKPRCRFLGESSAPYAGARGHGLPSLLGEQSDTGAHVGLVWKRERDALRKIKCATRKLWADKPEDRQNSLRHWAMVWIACGALYAPTSHASVEITSFFVLESVGTAPATITVRGADAQGWLLDYSTVDGTARDENTDNDYKSKSGTLLFTMSDSQKVVPITIVDDDEVEGLEFFSLEAFNVRRPAPAAVVSQSSSTWAVPGDVVQRQNGPDPVATGRITIVDNDGVGPGSGPDPKPIPSLGAIGLALLSLLTLGIAAIRIGRTGR